MNELRRVVGEQLLRRLSDQRKQSQKILELSDSHVYAQLRQLLFPARTFDVVLANLMPQDIETFLELLPSMQQVLLPGGALLFSIYGPDTFIELRSCLTKIGESLKLPDYLDMHDLGDILQQLNFQQVVVDKQIFSVNYRSFNTLMNDLKQQGVELPAAEQLLTLERSYEKLRNIEGKLPITYEIIFGYAEAPTQQLDNANKEVLIPMESIIRPKQ